MAILLNIDSAFEECTVSLSRNEEVIAHEKSIVQKDYASFLQPTIKKICAATHINLAEIDAVAVANGPGSYTGLRVGLASAKGICYALKKPLILLNTLDLLALAIKTNSLNDANVLYCPMIDARRMEVFTALYNGSLELIKDYASVILDNHFLQDERMKHTIIAGGNGSNKLKSIPGIQNIKFSVENYNTDLFIQSALIKFENKDFSNLAYSEPYYFKPVYIK